MSMTVLVLVLLISATLPACVRMFYPPLPAGASETDVGAVVVLAGGIGLDEQGWRLSDASLRRLLRGRDEARTRQLPLLLSGGVAGHGPDSPPEAELMAQQLDPAGFVELWLEADSHNTWANAENSAELLRARQISRVLLVTDREHMTRAMLCFQEQGIEVVPAPVDRLPGSEWAPSTAALAVLPYIWYEWAALIWYQFRY